MSQVQHVTISDQSGQRIDNFLLRTLKNVPRSRVYQMLRRGEVRVNGGRSKPSRRLEDGDVVRLPPWDDRATVRPAPSGSLQKSVLDCILHEDEALIVLNKPSGLAVHGGSGINHGLIESLREAKKEPRLELAHRLDRDTSGVLVVARNRQSLLKLHEAFRERTVSKTYEVYVEGLWSKRTTRLELPLERYVTASGERRVRVRSEGKSARTDFEIREVCPQATWLKVILHTGRTHQIRVHAASQKHPVIGDTKYNDHERALKSSRLCLHSARLVVNLDGDRRAFAAPVPEEMSAIWHRLSDSDNSGHLPA